MDLGIGAIMQNDSEIPKLNKGQRLKLVIIALVLSSMMNLAVVKLVLLFGMLSD